MSKQRKSSSGTKVRFQCLRCKKQFSGTKTIQPYLGRTALGCRGLAYHLNFSKDSSCLQYYMSSGNAVYDNNSNVKINLESSLFGKGKESLSTRQDSAMDEKSNKHIEPAHLKQKLGSISNELQKKFGILGQLSMQLGLDDKFCSALNQAVISESNLLNLTVPDHEVINDRLVAHFSPQALYDYLDEQYDLHPFNEEDDVEDDEEIISDDESVETDMHPLQDADVLSENEDDDFEPAVEMVLGQQERTLPDRDPATNWELIDRKHDELLRRAQCHEAMYYDLSDDLALVELVRRHRLPLSTVKDFSEWAHNAVQKRQNYFQGKPTTYGQIVSRLHRQLGLESTNEFQPHLVNWLPDETPVTVYIRPFLACVFELLDNPRNVGPGGQNISLPHPTDPYRSRPDVESAHVSELHHGKWWSQTWEKLCQPETKEILVPIILYMDGVTTDNNGKLKVTPLNMTLGIFNTSTRRRASAHTVKYYHPDEMAEAAFHQQTTKGVHNVQNLHRGIARAMEDFKELCDNGEPVAWQLPYAGRMWDVRMRFSIAFFIGDSVQHDPLCGKYVKYHGIQRMCRHCDCRSDDIDNPNAARVATLYKPWMLDPTDPERDAEFFRSISHYPIDNAFHKLCFGSNDYNIHLASPAELLHAVQKGPTSRLPEHVVHLIKNGSNMRLDECQAAEAKVKIQSTIAGLDILGKKMGILLGRQSDRDKPRTKFKNSLFSTAKKAGHEHSGVCLNLLLAMLTDRGRQLLLEERRLRPEFVENQIYATELCLEVEEWLKLETYTKEEMTPNKIQAAFDHFITRYSEICDRQGSGTKTLKTHLPLHMHQYIAMWGPPTGWDSGPSESHHKMQVKLPAKNTQRREVNFTQQVARRYHESVVIQKGQNQNQITNGVPMINNRRRRHDGNLFLKGAGFEVGCNLRGRPAMRWISKDNVGKQAFPDNVLRFICSILLPITSFGEEQERCIQGFTEMNSTFNDEGGDYIIFRAHPNYRSNSGQTCDTWYDWAMFHLPELFDDEDFVQSVPGRILSFVKVGELVGPSGYRGIGIEPSQPHCVVQLFEDPPTPDFRESNTGGDYSQLVQWGTLERGLYLIPCNKIVAPAIVVPNIPPVEREQRRQNDDDDNQRVALVDPIGGYFVVSNRREWAHQFTRLILDE